MRNDITEDRPAPEPDTEELVNPAAHFLDEWIGQNIDDAVIPPGLDPAAELAHQCFRDAASQGIGVEDIEGEVGDLEEYIAEALVEEHPGLKLDRMPPAPTETR